MVFTFSDIICAIVKKLKMIVPMIKHNKKPGIIYPDELVPPIIFFISSMESYIYISGRYISKTNEKKRKKRKEYKNKNRSLKKELNLERNARKSLLHI